MLAYFIGLCVVAEVVRQMRDKGGSIEKIKKAITKRVISELRKAMKKDAKAYDTFWEQFGKVLKEGLYEDIENREKVADITRVFSSAIGFPYLNCSLAPYNATNI